MPWAALAFLLVAAAVLLRGQIFGDASNVGPATVLVLIALAPLPAGALYAQMRSYLSLAAGIAAEVSPRVPA